MIEYREVAPEEGVSWAWTRRRTPRCRLRPSSPSCARCTPRLGSGELAVEFNADLRVHPFRAADIVRLELRLLRHDVDDRFRGAIRIDRGTASTDEYGQHGGKHQPCASHRRSIADQWERDQRPRTGNGGPAALPEGYDPDVGYPASPSARPAMSGPDLAVSIAVAIAAIGLTVTIVRLHRRRTAWPFAVAALALCVVAFFLGGVGYAVAVGA